MKTLQEQTFKRVVPTTHCIERYQEYCFDISNLEKVKEHLIGKLKAGRITKQAPNWVVAKRQNTLYLVSGKNLVFPLVKDKNSLVAVTCLHRQYKEKRKQVTLLDW